MSGFTISVHRKNSRIRAYGSTRFYSVIAYFDTYDVTRIRAFTVGEALEIKMTEAFVLVSSIRACIIKMGRVTDCYHKVEAALRAHFPTCSLLQLESIDFFETSVRLDIAD